MQKWSCLGCAVLELTFCCHVLAYKVNDTGKTSFSQAFLPCPLPQKRHKYPRGKADTLKTGTYLVMDSTDWFSQILLASLKGPYNLLMRSN